VASRALQRFPDAIGGLADDDKLDDLDPRVLTGDPDRFYATLQQRLDEAPLGPPDAPSTLSPASRLVDTCRNLDS
jgi:hypothetical protein